MLNAPLANPFAGMSRAEMDLRITSFMRETDIELLYQDFVKRATVLLRVPHIWQDGKEKDKEIVLDIVERDALMMETRRPLHQPPLMIALIILLAMGATVQGWDQVTANQAQQWYAGIDGFNLDPSSTTLLAIINAMPWASAGTVGVWMTDLLNRYCGRRGAIFIACMISSTSCIFQAASRNPTELILARLLLGIGIGLKSTTIPIYVAETSPKRVRGIFVMLWQMFTAFGILLGYASGVIFAACKGANKWRFTLGSPAVLPLLICAAIYTVPESPRWLILRARRLSCQPTYTTNADKPHHPVHTSKPATKMRRKEIAAYRAAFDSLLRLRATKLQAARDIFRIYYQVKGEERLRRNRNRMIELFSVPRNWAALRASIILMFFQQFCGVNVLAYYSSLVFVTTLCWKDNVLLKADKDKLNCPALYLSNDTPGAAKNVAANITDIALKLSLGFGLINFVLAIPAIWLIDNSKVGRRGLLLPSFLLMALAHLLTALFFQIRQGPTLTALVSLGIYLFDIFYSLGEGPVPFVYASESMPLYVRDLGMSVAVSVNWIFNFLLAISLESFWKNLGHTGTFLYYAGWCALGFFLVLLFVPETQGQSLEDLDEIFSLPTAEHVRYGWAQLTEVYRCITSFRKYKPSVLDFSSVRPRSYGMNPKTPLMSKQKKILFDRPENAAQETVPEDEEEEEEDFS